LNSQTGGETLSGKKLTVFGVIAAVGTASAVYGLYRTGLMKKGNFTRLCDAVKQSVDDKLKVVSEGRATIKPRNRSSKE